MNSSQAGHKWFAVFWHWMVRTENAAFRAAREEVAGGARGRVLEIGCGNGANFPYYGDEVEELVATDPDPYMLKRARERAAGAGRSVQVQQAPAQELSFEDGSFDTVVSTLVLCSVPDQQNALLEIRRVLKPQGELRFFEHVRYDHPLGAFWQDLVTPVWRWMGAGCHPNRARSIREGGFAICEIKSVTPVPPIPPMVFTRPCILGVAVPE